MLIITTFLFENRTGKEGYVQQTLCHEGTGREYKYSCTLYSNPALDGGGWLRLRPYCFIPGEGEVVPIL